LFLLLLIELWGPLFMGASTVTMCVRSRGKDDFDIEEYIIITTIIHHNGDHLTISQMDMFCFSLCISSVSFNRHEYSYYNYDG
jgi:hypothetical protein